MTILELPWVEITILLPLLGALLVSFCREPEHGWWLMLGSTVLTLFAAILSWVGLLVEAPTASWSFFPLWGDRALFRIDSLSGPLLPLVAVIHMLLVLSTPRVKIERMTFSTHLIGESIRLATFACLEPWPLIVMIGVCALPPYIEMLQRGRSTRIFTIHMLLFMGLLSVGWAAASAGYAIGAVLLLAAVLVRNGTFPVHLWVADLFENATFGTALLFAAPLAGVYIALRLVLPVAPEWVLQSIGIASLITTIYAAGMALVQREARRFFAYLFLSYASLVLVGLELHTVTSLTGSLCLWGSVTLSLGGLGIILRVLEFRYGRLPLNGYLGLYDQSPMLAIGFLLTGLGSVGFPGTLGFIAAELLMDGAIHANVFVGLVLVFAAALNGIAVVRVYLLLFTGTRYPASMPIRTTLRERIVVLSLCALILGGGLIPQLGVANRHESAKEIMAVRWVVEE